MPKSKVKIRDRELALDARPDRLDLRDRTFLPELRSLPPRYPSDAQLARWLPAYVDAGLVRDQGEDGACTGFGLAAVIDYLHFVRDVQASENVGAAAQRRASPAMLYELARLYDEWPGEDYDGSSCRGALKGWQRHGVCREELWSYKIGAKGKRVFVHPSEDSQAPDDPDRNWDVDALRCTLGVYYRIDSRSVVDMQAAIATTGAVYCSATVHEGWNVRSKDAPRSHRDLVEIKHVAKPKDVGGHAFALVGYNEQGFIAQNSWGTGWASKGFALLPYADWVEHGDDAWVFTLGVPGTHASPGSGARRARAPRSPRFFVPASDPGQRVSIERLPGIIAGSDALDRRFRNVPAPFRPLESEAAYRHTLVLDRGFPVRNDITTRDTQHAVEAIGHDFPGAWLQEKGAKKIVVYAHGGLNSEADSITRIRALAPYALESGIYPLFVTWRSGALEALGDMVQELFVKLGFGDRGVRPSGGFAERIAERTDRMLEPLLRTPGGALWQQMKLNAGRASVDEAGGCRLLVEQLDRLVQALRTPSREVEIHLVGHSAGAIVLGAMLDEMRYRKLRVASLRLFAPACTLRFALDHYKPALDDKIVEAKHWHICNLSDENERNDSVGPYRKSLLYLVSRSFEDVYNMPLLGLNRSFRAQTPEDEALPERETESLKDWQAFWSALGIEATNLHVLKEKRVSTGGDRIASSHGCFDNSIEFLGDAFGYVVDPEDPRRVKIHRLDY
jgi:hypothetical protein